MTKGNENSRAGFSRRKVLGMAVIGVCAGIAAPLAGLLRPAQAAAIRAEGKKILIVYFSRTGNTRAMAEHIQSAVGGNLVGLEAATPYPDAYRDVTKQAKQELEAGFKPPLKTRIADVASYDIVFVGSPSWWATLAPPVQTFLTENDFSGKTVVPFVTHEGSGLGKSVLTLINLCQGATIPAGLALRGRTVALSRNKVEQWLREIGMTA